MNEIKKCKVFRSDLIEVNLVYQFPPEEIHGLIGEDVVGKLYTGNMKQLQSWMDNNG